VFERYNIDEDLTFDYQGHFGFCGQVEQQN